MTNDLVKGLDAVGSVFGVLDRHTKIDPANPAGYKPDKIAGHVELCDVQFANPSRLDVMIFNSFSINIAAGESTALVGQSGLGKSTIIGLVERFYDPLKGLVKVDGHNIYKNIQSKDIKEPDCTTKAANAHSFIAGLQDGYDTWCRDKGLQLSGEQKQRIAIARAILKNPTVLLLDEATSALDSQSEKLVQDALEHVMVGRASIVVAHRFSTIQNYNRIAVLDKGKLVEEGTHSSLLGKGSNGAYYSLVSLERTSDVAHTQL
ncbi:hypothetical protein Vadar_012531 [Vaccinium darrowii]|uniref:Uncharacterized protein n=1 Tax=Vaccinium darrowii TaxID=229202 RepID=A0ACB7X9N5_9ERIC|nr:hypothetical protein Vadar_012531 [Vaccinium darrowii]